MSRVVIAAVAFLTLMSIVSVSRAQDLPVLEGYPTGALSAQYTVSMRRVNGETEVKIDRNDGTLVTGLLLKVRRNHPNGVSSTIFISPVSSGQWYVADFALASGDHLDVLFYGVTMWTSFTNDTYEALAPWFESRHQGHAGVVQDWIDSDSVEVVCQGDGMVDVNFEVVKDIDLLEIEINGPTTVVGIFESITPGWHSVTVETGFPLLEGVAYGFYMDAKVDGASVDGHSMDINGCETAEGGEGDGFSFRQVYEVNTDVPSEYAYVIEFFSRSDEDIEFVFEYLSNGEWREAKSSYSYEIVQPGVNALRVNGISKSGSNRVIAKKDDVEVGTAYVLLDGDGDEVLGLLGPTSIDGSDFDVDGDGVPDPLEPIDPELPDYEPPDPEEIPDLEPEDYDPGYTPEDPIGGGGGGGGPDPVPGPYDIPDFGDSIWRWIPIGEKQMFPLTGSIAEENYVFEVDLTIPWLGMDFSQTINTIPRQGDAFEYEIEFVRWFLKMLGNCLLSLTMTMSLINFWRNY